MRSRKFRVEQGGEVMVVWSWHLGHRYNEETRRVYLDANALMDLGKLEKGIVGAQGG